MKLVIPGKPIGKPRMTQQDRWKKRPRVVRYRQWSDLARVCVLEQIGQLPDPEQIESLSWVAYFMPPKSWSAKRKAEAIGTLHRQKPDRDNIDKAVLDSLFDRDQAIAAGRIEKRWGESERIEIEIEVNASVAGG